MSKLRYLALAVISAAVAVGCGGGQSSADAAPVAAGAPAAGDPALRSAPSGANAAELAALTSLPGVPKEAVADPSKIFSAEGQVVASRYGGPRKDPFALKSPERSFEIQQDSARLLGTMGSWTFMYTPEPEKPRDAGTISDPQPYRRLSGIIVGDSVYAIMDSGDGNPVIIRPGMKVPNTEWVVVSIDSEKAILRRSGNKVPREITVRLESPPGGIGGGGGGQPGGPMGGPPMGPGGPGGPSGAPGGLSPGGNPGA